MKSFRVIIFVAVLALILFALYFLGSYHIITGPGISGAKFAKKGQFTFSETFIDLGKLGGKTGAEVMQIYPKSFNNLRQKGFLRIREPDTDKQPVNVTQ